jgi:hypothetical protein
MASNVATGASLRTRESPGRVVQRHALYLGEINDSQELAWRRSIELLEDGAGRPRTLSLFPEDRCEGLLADASIVGVKLSELRLRRPRQWGACWLALMLWRELQLDQFWSTRLGVSHKGTHWGQVLFVLVAYRLLAPGSEWRLHREWFQRSALADLLGEDVGLAEIHKLYRCHDRLLEHKQAMIGQRYSSAPALSPLSWAKRANSAATSPPCIECFDIFAPPPGDSEVISQVTRLSN